jgi:hypothetical protein
MKTHANSARTVGFLSHLITLGLLLGLSGCGADSATPLEASVDDSAKAKPAAKPRDRKTKPAKADTKKPEKPVAKSAPARPLEELANIIEVALTDSASTNRSDPNRDRAQRAAAMLKQIDIGVAAADELIAAYPKDHTAVAKAWRDKLTLLYQGARNKLDGLADQLDEASANVAATQYQEEAEYGDGLVFGIRHLHSDKPVHEVVAELSRHTKSFPKGKSSARLFLAYAKELVEKNQKADASSVCQVALWELHDHPELGHIRSYVNRMEKGEVRRVASRKRDLVQKLIENQIAQIRPSLPLQLDELTILYEVDTEYRMVIYKYRVALDRAEFRAEQRTIEEEVSRKARSASATKKMLEKGIRMKYMYFGKDGTPYHDFIVQKR